MIRPNVHLIAAIGHAGQIGDKGLLPWPAELGDLPLFRETTRYCVLVMGRRTAVSVGPLRERVIRIWDGQCGPETFLDAIEADRDLPFWANSGRTAKPTIWIAGGAHTYSAFLPYCHTIRLTRIDWNGEADTTMPALWASAQ